MAVHIKKQLLATELLSIKRREWFLYGLVFIIWAVWNVLSLQNQNTRVAQIKVSDTALFLIRVSVVIPYLIAWESAVHALVRLRRYAEAIGKTHEGRGFHHFFRGMVILLVGMIFVTMIPSIRNILRENGHPLEILTIITNYAYVVPYLFAFLSFFLGARELSFRVHTKPSRTLYYIYGALLAIFTYIWLDLIFTNPVRTASADPAIPVTYYLRDSLIVLTIVFPSVIAWVLGFLGVMQIKHYGTEVKGVIYRSALHSFVKGVGGVIIGSILLQGLLSLGTARLLQLGLDKLLVIIYLFLIIQTLGFFFMAQGAYRLTRIESV